MKVYGNSSRIICIIMGMLLLATAIYGLRKTFNAVGYEATIVRIVDYFTSNKSVRNGNNGGKDTYEEYGMVCDITILVSGETIEQRIEVTRRNKENLPIQGDHIVVEKQSNGLWYEQKKESVSWGMIIMGAFGLLLLIAGFKAKNVQ